MSGAVGIVPIFVDNPLCSNADKHLTQLTRSYKDTDRLGNFNFHSSAGVVTVHHSVDSEIHA